MRVPEAASVGRHGERRTSTPSRPCASADRTAATIDVVSDPIPGRKATVVEVTVVEVTVPAPRSRPAEQVSSR